MKIKLIAFENDVPMQLEDNEWTYYKSMLEEAKNRYNNSAKEDEDLPEIVKWNISDGNEADLGKVFLKGAQSFTKAKKIFDTLLGYASEAMDRRFYRFEQIVVEGGQPPSKPIKDKDGNIIFQNLVLFTFSDFVNQNQMNNAPFFYSKSDHNQLYAKNEGSTFYVDLETTDGYYSFNVGCVI